MTRREHVAWVAAATLIAAVSCTSGSGAGGPTASGGAGGERGGAGGAGGGAGDVGGGAAGAGSGAGGTVGSGDAAVRKKAMFQVIDPVADQAPRSTDRPGEFIRRTFLVGASRDGLVVVGDSQLLRIGDAAPAEGMEPYRWTEATGVVGLGFDPSLNMGDKRFLQSFTELMSADGSVVILRSSSSTPNLFRWSQASGLAPLGMVAGADVTVGATSADGSVLVGSAMTTPGPSTSSHYEAVRWTPSGMERLGVLPGHTDSVASDVSTDGTVVVGSSRTATSAELVRWKGGSGIVSLGKPSAGFDGCDTAPGGISADASVIVGTCTITTVSPTITTIKPVAFRWTEATGIALIGTLPGRSESDWVAATADGAVVVGNSYETTAASSQAFRWTAATGIVALGVLPGDDSSRLGSADRNAGRLVLSSDGKIVIGSSRSGNLSHAFRWTEGAGMASLQPLAGDDGSAVEAVSADGLVAVGASSQGTQTRAVWWDRAGAPHVIAADLMAAGADLAGFQPVSARLISGSVNIMLAGNGYTADNGYRTWVARLP